MTDEIKRDVIRLLINDALEASNNSFAEATCLLSEAMISIILTQHQGVNAVEVAMMMAGAMVDHIKTFSGFPSRAVMEVSVSGDVDAIAAADDRESDRLGAFLTGGSPFDSDGDLSDRGRGLGSREEWEHSAHSYCMAALCGTQNGTRGGMVTVSAAALGLQLGLTERWGIGAGAIPVPGDAA